MLDLLKQDAQVGDSLNLFLTSGDTVNGVIIEIGENYLLIEVDGVKRRYFPQLIGGWDVVNEVSQSEPLTTSSVEQPSDVEEQNKEESGEDEINDVIISLFDSIYENEHIVMSTAIKTNAVVEKVYPTGVSVISDSGETIICHKGFMVGFSRANCTPGKRLFCGTVNTSGPQKGICFQSVLQMSFKEMRERFIVAVSSKPAPRKPIINSVISYFRKNNSGKPTKKIIADIRTKLNLLWNTGKVGNTQLDN